MAANYHKAWSVCELALVLWHGQASVERGFSVNKELVVENQSEQTLAARRIIKDHVIHVNGVTNVEIHNMVSVARNARARYTNYLAQQKEEQEAEKQNKKKKRRNWCYTWIRGQTQMIEDGHFFLPVHFKAIVWEVRAKWRVTVSDEN